MTAWLGLVLALASAIAVNWAHTQEHDAAAALPRLPGERTPDAAAVGLSRDDASAGSLPAG